MNLFDALFGCSHKQMSFPMTRKDKFGAKHTTRCCLDCGKEFPYSWDEMQIVRPAQCEAGRREEVVA